MSAKEPVGAILLLVFPTWVFITVFLTNFFDLLQAAIFGFVLAVISTLLVTPAVFINIIGFSLIGLWLIVQFYRLVVSL